MAAVGDVQITSNALRATKLLHNQAVNTGQPALVTDGVPSYQARVTGSGAGSADTGVNYVGRPSREASIVIKGTGTGVVAGTFRLWGYSVALADWVPVGTGADTTKGTLNGGAAIGETKADVVLHSEPFLLAGHFDRLFLELLSVSGTSPSFNAWIVVPRTVQF